MHILLGESNEQGSTQNPQNEWKNSKISEIVDFSAKICKYFSKYSKLIRLSRLSKVWHCERIKSVDEVVTIFWFSVQWFGQPKCFITLNDTHTQKKKKQ